MINFEIWHSLFSTVQSPIAFIVKSQRYSTIESIKMALAKRTRKHYIILLPYKSFMSQRVMAISLTTSLRSRS